MPVRRWRRRQPARRMASTWSFIPASSTRARPARGQVRAPQQRRSGPRSSRRPGGARRHRHDAHRPCRRSRSIHASTRSGRGQRSRAMPMATPTRNVMTSSIPLIGRRRVDGADVPGGGNRESVFITPARRHSESVRAAGRRSYSAVWAMLVSPHPVYALANDHRAEPMTRPGGSAAALLRRVGLQPEVPCGGECRPSRAHRASTSSSFPRRSRSLRSPRAS